MKAYRFVTSLVSLVGIILTGPLVVQAAEKDFLDYVNNRPPFREHHTWAVFLGTGWTPEGLEQIRQWEREGKWINPFTGRPFEDVKVFVFGQKNPVLEALRVIGDHFEIHVLSSWEELKGHHFDFGICHSNGCPNALDAHRMGIMRVDTFLALGTDWTSKAFRPGDLKGAKLYFFAMKGDPIWKSPASNWARITEATPGFSFSIPFDHPQDIVRGMGKLLTQGRADPDRFPVIRLTPPPGRGGTVLKPLQPHALVDSYFQAIGWWMKSEGSLQKALTEKIRQVETSAWREDQKKSEPSPPGCGRSSDKDGRPCETDQPKSEPYPPWCPWCGGGGGSSETDQPKSEPSPPWCPWCGGGGGSSGGGSISQGPGSGMSPSAPGTDPRGGIAAEIQIHPQDFRSK